MKKVSQVIPKSQKEILVQALDIMESAIKTIKSEDEALNHKLFDILTLKALFNQTELVVNLPFKVYDNFTSINGVDFPEYGSNKLATTWKDCKIVSLRESDKMIALGFKMDFSVTDENHNRITPNNPPLLSVTYIRDRLNVWNIKEAYQTALLENSQYINHKQFKTLDAVINHFG
jgi:hypothetical protein